MSPTAPAPTKPCLLPQTEICQPIRPIPGSYSSRLSLLDTYLQTKSISLQLATDHHDSLSDFSLTQSCYAHGITLDIAGDFAHCISAYHCLTI